MTTINALKETLDTFTEDELQSIAEFMAFLKFRTQQIPLIPEIEDTPKDQVLTDFHQAWHEASTDQGVPVAQLREELENE